MMAIPLTTPASLDFATLQIRINEEESNAFVRLTSLIGKTESGVGFNAHVYESVDDHDLPLSKLFSIADGGQADNDPDVKSWLKLNPTQKIRSDAMVYISNSLTKIAIVN